jgi:MerR family transcriptional regulator, light-induced transcriptional regulator
MSTYEGSIEWLDLERYSDTPMFNTKAVVQQTGVPAPTLRAWERRYTLIAPERGDNAYRLYSERHIVLIRWLKERIDAGMSISQAIALFRYLIDEHQQEAAALLSSANIDFSSPETARAFTITLPLSKTPLSIPDEHPLPSLETWPPFDNNDNNDNNDNHFRPQGYPATQNMHVTRERLIDTFRNLDEPMAHMIMSTMLSIYPVEQVCIELITPTMCEIGRLWIDKHLTVPEEHFASNFFRALLINLFHITPGPLSGPHALVCCAPGEAHELGALMLALFLRRRGIRVAYMGQSIETAGLLYMVRKLMPALVCVSLTMPNYLPALISLGRQLHTMLPPRPIFAFGGLIFSQSQYSSTITQIPGIYLQGDLRENADRLRVLMLERLENKN